MNCTLHLDYSYTNSSGALVTGRDDLPLQTLSSISAQGFSSRSVSRSSSLIENGKYTIGCTLRDPVEPVSSATLHLNGEIIADAPGLGYPNTDGDIQFTFRQNNELPFLLVYDIVQLEVRFFTSEENTLAYISEDLLCLSTSIVDSENVKGMITEIATFEDPIINDWMFRPTQQMRDEFGIVQDEFRDRCYASLASYVQIIEEICLCYSQYLGYFRTQPHSVLQQQHTLQPFEKTRRISTDSVVWLAQNLDQLQEVARSSIIRNGQSYLPVKMLAAETKKCLDIYENQVVIAFLRAVYLKNTAIISSFEEHILKEEEFIALIKALEKDEYRAPIVAVKEMTLRNVTDSIQLLKRVNDRLRELLAAYKRILPCSAIPFNKIPRKTKVFQEIRAYARVYEQLLRWVRFGEFHFERDNLLLNIRKTDKLFEYYCLYRLLHLLKLKGFQEISPDTIFSYFYPVSRYAKYKNETAVANTYQLTDGKDILTLFYTPVVYSHKTENSIDLYRTTNEMTQFTYFAPDFLIKIESSSQKDAYIILDAKYSRFYTIKEKYLNKEIEKYVNQIAHIDNSYPAIVMMWLLQGRIDSCKTAEPYHTSEMAKKYRPIPSIGIIPVNTSTTDLSALWKEIQAVTHLHPRE